MMNLTIDTDSSFNNGICLWQSVMLYSSSNASRTDDEEMGDTVIEDRILSFHKDLAGNHNNNNNNACVNSDEIRDLFILCSEMGCENNFSFVLRALLEPNNKNNNNNNKILKSKLALVFAGWAAVCHKKTRWFFDAFMDTIFKNFPLDENNNNNNNNEKFLCHYYTLSSILFSWCPVLPILQQQQGHTVFSFSHKTAIKKYLIELGDACALKVQPPRLLYRNMTSASNFTTNDPFYNFVNAYPEARKDSTTYPNDNHNKEYTSSQPLKNQKTQQQVSSTSPMEHTLLHRRSDLTNDDGDDEDYIMLTRHNSNESVKKEEKEKEPTAENNNNNNNEVVKEDVLSLQDSESPPSTAKNNNHNNNNSASRKGEKKKKQDKKKSEKKKKSKEDSNCSVL